LLARGPECARPKGPSHDPLPFQCKYSIFLQDLWHKCFAIDWRTYDSAKSCPNALARSCKIPRRRSRLMPETREEPEQAGSAKHEASTSRSSHSFGAESPTRESGSGGGQSSPVTTVTREAPKKRRKVNHGQENPACLRPIMLTILLVQHVFIVGAR
jgi:hypothetical protein